MPRRVRPEPQVHLRLDAYFLEYRGTATARTVLERITSKAVALAGQRGYARHFVAADLYHSNGNDKRVAIQVDLTPTLTPNPNPNPRQEQR